MNYSGAFAVIRNILRAAFEVWSWTSTHILSTISRNHCCRSTMD